MPCIRSSVGRIATLSLPGMALSSCHFWTADGVLCSLEQNTGVGGGAYTDIAPTYCVHAPPAPFTLQAVHTRA
jgi:hypothetical protein